MSGQIWAVDSLGGYLSNDDYSEKIREAAQPMMLFRAHVAAEAEKGEHGRGDTSMFQKIRNIATAGAALSETETIPKSNIVIVQDSVTVNEYGNSVPFTEKLTSLNRIQVPELIRSALVNDQAKVLDSLAATQFKATSWKAVCENTATTVISTNTTAGTAAAANPSDKNIRDIVDTLKKANTPKLSDGMYRAILSTNAIRGVFDYFESKANYTTLGIARSGLVGDYYGLRMMEETNVLSNIIGTGSVYGEGIVFGADAVRERIVTPEEVRIKIPTDFGRDRGIAWYYLGGFKLVWNHTSDNEARVIHITST